MRTSLDRQLATAEAHSDAFLNETLDPSETCDQECEVDPRNDLKAPRIYRILLVDRHNLFLEAVEALLKTEYEVRHVTLEDAQEGLTSGVKIQPDIVVLNPMVGGFNHLELVRRVRVTMPAAKILYLTETASVSLASAAFANGVSGFLVKNSSMDDFMAALHALEQEKLFLDPSLAGGNVDAVLQFQSPIARLTPRELEVLGLLLRGWTMKQVARKLNVKPRTVAFHKYRAMQTLEVQNNAQLIEAVSRLGLLDVD